MCFVDSRGSREELNWNGAMSVLKLDDPLDLSPTPYNQALMLTLLWQTRPERVYVAGFAGGRIPLIFHHYFPEIVIDSTDIESEVVELARKYFGIEYDDRQRVFIADGRHFLENREASVQYDFIFVDAFCGKGCSPRRLATVEFYQLCKMHLKTGGVVAVNLVESDPLFGSRIATIASCFEHTYVQIDRTIVLFSTDSPLPLRDDFIGRAEALQEEHNFSFGFVERAATLKLLKNVEELRRLHEESPVLTDVSDKWTFVLPSQSGDSDFQ